VQQRKDVNEREDNDAFMRRITYCEEERRLRTSVPWSGGYRWFKSENVVCIEHYRKPQTTTPPPTKPQTR
jgi:hypothetical protein